MAGLPDEAFTALTRKLAHLADNPWDSRHVWAEDQQGRQTDFGESGQGLVSFYLQDKANILMVWDVTWVG